MAASNIANRCTGNALILSVALMIQGLTWIQIAHGEEPEAEETIEELAETCAGCHGENGVPQEKSTPIIWGQNEGYMYLQMRDFQKGTRKDPSMTGIVADLSRDQVRGLAAHFAKKPWPNLQHPSPSGATIKKAKTATAAMSCTVCHMGEYEGDGTTGRLAGQSKEYLDKTSADFRSNHRANNPGMANIMRAMKEDEIDALNDYLASLVLQPSAGRR